TFFYTQKSSIISMVDLPTTDIIEPIEKGSRVDRTLEPFQYILLLGAYLLVIGRLQSFYPKKLYNVVNG
ncbi:hypothetical protein ACJBWB_12140, partial [Streptococcus suis]